jgi:putative phage-type endonuclease
MKFPEINLEIFKEYIINNIHTIIKYDFDSNLTTYIHNVILTDIPKEIQHKYKKKIDKRIKIIKKQLYTKVIPPRSYKKSFIRKVSQNTVHLTDKIKLLTDIPQPAQRTDEWYVFRHNLLTASSIWKVFGSQSSQNQLIYEKCKPYAIYKSSPINSPLYWGQKYEPISVEFYKKLYKTEVSDFGCIKHLKYPFIGASPDGINTDITNSRYGRMLEIKNVVSREITGIPKLEYWIQMQLQMETCDLNECDFLETKFTEYESEDAFINDGTYTYSAECKLKGKMIIFSNNGNLHHEYGPLYVTEQEYNIWEKHILEKNSHMEWIQNIFWKLEKYSNVLVLRNKLWFNNVVPLIEKLWESVIAERVTGFDHRAPKQRKTVVNKTELVPNTCYLLRGEAP